MYFNILFLTPHAFCQLIVFSVPQFKHELVFFLFTAISFREGKHIRDLGWSDSLTQNHGLRACVVYTNGDVQSRLLGVHIERAKTHLKSPWCTNRRKVETKQTTSFRANTFAAFCGAAKPSVVILVFSLKDLVKQRFVCQVINFVYTNKS